MFSRYVSFSKMANNWFYRQKSNQRKRQEWLLIFFHLSTKLQKAITHVFKFFSFFYSSLVQNNSLRIFSLHLSFHSILYLKDSFPCSGFASQTGAMWSISCHKDFRYYIIGTQTASAIQGNTPNSLVFWGVVAALI